MKNIKGFSLSMLTLSLMLIPSMAIGADIANEESVILSSVSVVEYGSTKSSSTDYATKLFLRGVGTSGSVYELTITNGYNSSSYLETVMQQCSKYAALVMTSESKYDLFIFLADNGSNSVVGKDESGDRVIITLDYSSTYYQHSAYCALLTDGEEL